ncbi:hypothetical protein BGZ65_011286 [Modicella reniformis]|uniref:Uncharacterized protein n=1 Tax=Modicella reniformis TaxID=1440133 RepID=A0A9P6IL48_9FUNG|nr:hypothetical protein BGZ65_011286 [Modicella reniformis]
MTCPYARLLAKPRAGKEVGYDQHPLWAKAVNMISSKLPTAPEGLSRTSVEYFTQLATAITNIWSGSTYAKSLEYLTRVLLRLHLAPNREKAFQRCSRLKAQGKETTRPQQWTRNYWKWRMSQLFKELVDARESGRTKRTKPLLRLLLRTNNKKPFHNTGSAIPTINKQLEQWSLNQAKHLNNSEISDSNVTAAPIQGTLEEELSVFVHQNEDADLDAADEFGWLDDLNLQEYKEPPSTPVNTTTCTIPDRSHFKESTRAQLKALQRVLITLLESPSIVGSVSPAYVKTMAYEATNFTDHECETVVFLTNVLRRYVPKRRPGDDGRSKTSIEHEHAATRCRY